jgi:ribonuclease HI
LAKRGSRKTYVVWSGRTPGIYDTWAGCKAQVDNYPGAKYKSFPDDVSAREAWQHGPIAVKSHSKTKTEAARNVNQTVPLVPSICVDAACSGNPGPVEYRGVITETGLELFRAGPFENGTVNIGEFLAIVHALALLQKEGKVLPVYSDSRTALKWVSTGKASTKLEPGKQNAKLFELISRAETWLGNHKDRPALLKWDTKAWGEIPADFGRK